MLAKTGDPIAGLKRLETGLAQQRQVAANEDLAVYLCLPAETLMELGRPDEAVQRINDDRTLLHEAKLWVWYPELLRTLAEATLAAQPDQHETALVHLASAAELAGEQQAYMLALRIAMARAHLLRLSGAHGSAADHVRSALDEIPEPDESRDLVSAQQFICELIA